MRELSLFTGAGGGLLGTKLLGFKHVGYVEINDYCQRIIAQRIKDGILDDAPIFGDIRTFISEGYARAYKGMVDVVTGGFPCQPFSIAGKSLGEFDPRNMWPETLSVIRMVEPPICFLENVPGLLIHSYYGRILRDLAESGYDVRWITLGGGNLYSPLKRDRLWILGFHNQINGNGNKKIHKRTDSKIHFWSTEPSCHLSDVETSWLMAHSFGVREIDDLASWVDRYEAIGNGQMAIVVKAAWQLLNNCLNL